MLSASAIPSQASLRRFAFRTKTPSKASQSRWPAGTVPLTAYFLSTHDSALYEYDFGDSWEHDVVLQSVGIRHPRTKYPRCLDGARACPPEDCGGTSGYDELLAIMADSEHEEYESTLEWLGGSFESEKFDASKVKFDNPGKRWRIALSGERGARPCVA